MQKLTVATIFKVVLLFLLFFLLHTNVIPPEAHAYTYDDVGNYFKNHPAPQGCVNFIEASGSGYVIKQRCDTNPAHVKLTINGGILYDAHKLSGGDRILSEEIL